MKLRRVKTQYKMITTVMMLTMMISYVNAIKPLKTGVVPSMEVFDEEHVLIDYVESFIIQDFSMIEAISVYLANTTKNIAVATREDFSNTQNKHKIWQNLKEKTKLKGKLNPCQPTEFFVRIVFSGEPGGYLDSAVGVYNPDTVIMVGEL